MCDGTSPVLRRVVFDSNLSIIGAGLYSNDGDPAVVEGLFIDNESANGQGAGAYLHGGGRCYNTTFHHNRCVDGVGGLSGFGGGVYCAKGQVFANCKWTDNGATYGGGVYTEYSAFQAVNCTIVGNDASGNGGGIFAFDEDLDEPESTLVNSILWDNHDNTEGTPNDGESAQIFDSNGAIDVTYTDVMNCDGSGYCASPTVTHNTGDDPQFVNLADRDLHLTACSLLIDRGNTPAMLDDGTTVGIGPINLDEDGDTNCSGCTIGERIPDLDRAARVVDDVGVPDTGVVDGACHVSCELQIDFGAYEWFDCGGDLNGDGKLNGLDIQPFVDCIIQGPDIENGCRCADMNHDNLLTVAGDLGCFIQSLLEKTNVCALSGSCNPGPVAYSRDCNANTVPDATDIANGTSQDCNKNGIPDECDLDVGDPDGNTVYSLDVNGNDIPDECETDCNTNSVPDDWDISQSTSNDVNSNDIPDECEQDCNGNDVPDSYDISTSNSDDCNANGIPDECEDDCNGNDIPDDCDIANSTSVDCNDNGIPDECDVARAFQPSFDCNDNGIPDECDIANSTSADANENGIPDECEEEGRSITEGGSEFDDDAAWEAFYMWYDEQMNGTPGDWNTLTGPERFDRVMDELAILGLPLESPW